MGFVCVNAFSQVAITKAKRGNIWDSFIAVRVVRFYVMLIVFLVDIGGSINALQVSFPG
jgi:hypothetical protein